MKVLCIYFENSFSKNEELHHIGEIFYRATPQIMLRSNDALLLEIGKCQSLYSEEVFIKRTLATLNRLGLAAKLGVANDIPTALGFAFYRQKEKLDLPIEALSFYANPLGGEIDLEKKISKMISLMKDLGVKKMKDFLKIPQREISSRFGSIGQMCFLRLQGLSEILWKPFALSETFIEKSEFDLESPVDSLEPIYSRIKLMLDRLTLRLRSQGKRLKQFEVLLKQEHALKPEDLVRHFQILLQLPYVSNKVIYQIIQEKVDAAVSQHPLRARVTEVSLLAFEVVPYSMTQKDLFQQKKEETQENFYHLVSRLSTKLGDGSVFFAQARESYLPEKNWLRTSELIATKIKDALPERPLRIFNYPKPVQYVGRRMIATDISEEVEKYSDKEVVLADWWDSPIERMYYRVLTKTGRELWLYRTSRGDFLQGEFD